MVAPLLDNPIWASLSTRHASVSEIAGDVARYPPVIAPFLGFHGAGTIEAAALDLLVRRGETVFLIGPRPAVPSGWRVDDLGLLIQMTCESSMSNVGGPPIVSLTEGDQPSVRALTALVYPHYFRELTTDLGRYFGILEGDRLAAMIGERMAPPGFREISALCTHPDFVGRGLARRLLAFLTNDNLQRGEIPFLHVSPRNERAKRLYDQSGYRTRSEVPFWSLRRAA